MEKLNVEKIVKERIKENKKIFNKEELIFLNNNVNIIKKIYLVGIVDGLLIKQSGQKSGQNKIINYKTLE